MWPCPIVTYFSTFSHKRRDFRVKLLNVKRVFQFSAQILPATFIILRRIQRDIMNVHKYSCQVPVIAVSGVPRNFFRGGVQQIQLRTEDRENGDLGAVAP
jgi:hypothetical protein